MKNSQQTDPFESTVTPSKIFIKDKKSLGRVIVDKRNKTLQDNLIINNQTQLSMADHEINNIRKGTNNE